MRLFIAVNFPDTLRSALWESVEPARRAGRTPAVRWVRPDGIHLTLKFLGEVAEERTAELSAALHRAVAGIRAFPVTVGGGGAFPDERRPRVLWVGVSPAPALELLQHAVEREFGPLGFPPDGRPFRPHVTLGRAARDAVPTDLRRAAERLVAVAYEETVQVERLELMRSTLRGGGAVYAAVAAAGLA